MGGKGKREEEETLIATIKMKDRQINNDRAMLAKHVSFRSFRSSHLNISKLIEIFVKQKRYGEQVFIIIYKMKNTVFIVYISCAILLRV